MVILAKADCPACKRPTVTLAYGLSYCAACQLVKLEKSSQYDFLTFNGEMADCRPRGASFDLLITGHPGYTIVADYVTGGEFFASEDRLDAFPSGASVYFDFAPATPVYFSTDDIKTGWAENFLAYFSRLDCGEKITALDYFLWCRQDDLSEWDGAFVCSHHGGNDSAITEYANYLQDSGMYSDANIPQAYINWESIARDSWLSGDVFFTDRFVFNNL